MFSYHDHLSLRILVSFIKFIAYFVAMSIVIGAICYIALGIIEPIIYIPLAVVIATDIVLGDWMPAIPEKGR